LDVTTASRFHLGELAISAVIKLSVIFFLGAEMVGVIVFEVLVVLTSQFQHSNIRVPERFERLWLAFFVPPSMHRIHHSVVIHERNTNYGTILSIWEKGWELSPMAWIRPASRSASLSEVVIPGQEAVWLVDQRDGRPGTSSPKQGSATRKRPFPNKKERR
jgi:hypothetical protein